MKRDLRQYQSTGGHAAANPERAALCLRLKQARIDAGLTQQQVADSLGLDSRAQIANLEAGRSVIGDEHLRLMARMYGVRVGWLFGEV